ncbi:hypothetical protein HGM15179_006403, partial [Zosterops borbonicus]
PAGASLRASQPCFLAEVFDSVSALKRTDCSADSRTPVTLVIAATDPGGCTCQEGGLRLVWPLRDCGSPQHKQELHSSVNHSHLPQKP